MMYHFEGRIACRDGYYVSREVSYAAMVTIFSTDAWTNMSPMGLELRDNECVSLVRHASLYLTLHSIALHILIISELVILFC